MEQKILDGLKRELAVKAKNGLDFIGAAAIIWIGIGWVWTLSFSSYNKSVFTFIIGGFMLPLAWMMSLALILLAVWLFMSYQKRKTQTA